MRLREVKSLCGGQMTNKWHLGTLRTICRWRLSATGVLLPASVRGGTRICSLAIGFLTSSSSSSLLLSPRPETFSPFTSLTPAPPLICLFWESFLSITPPHLWARDPYVTFHTQIWSYCCVTNCLCPQPSAGLCILWEQRWVCLIPSGIPSARKEKEWREGRKARRKGKKEGGFG